MEYITIPMRQKHYDYVLKLWQDRMGRNYPDESKLEDAIDKNKLGKSGFVTINNQNEVLGFSIGEIIPRKKVEQMVPSLDIFDKNVDNIGFFDLNVVKKSLEGNGIGEKQIKVREKYFKNKDVTHFFAICWIRDEHYNSQAVLEKVGFTCLQKINNFWYEETKKRNAECIDCGYPCTCTAGIYKKVI